MPSNSDYRIRVLDTTAAFDAARDQWQALEREVDHLNVTASYNWLRTWWEVFGDCEEEGFGSEKRLCILFLYDEQDVLRAIAPFCEITRKMGFMKYRAVEFLAQQWGATYLDIIAAGLTSAEREHIFDWLYENRKFDVIELRYIPSFSAHFDLSGSDVFLLSGCPEIKADSYEAVRRDYYGKNMRHKLKRLRNRIEREKIGLETAYRTSEDILAHFDEVRAVSFSKEMTSKRSVYRNAHKERFIRAVIEAFSERALCLFVSHQGEVVAYNLGFHVHGKYYAYDAAYSRRAKGLEKFSLGNLAYDLLIQHVFDAGVKEFCLGTGVDPYKLKFSKDVVGLYCVLRGGNRLRGRIWHLLRSRLNRRTEEAFAKVRGENVLKG